MALEEIGALDEYLGEPPVIDERARSIWSAYWQMRAFQPLDEPLHLANVCAWLDAHDLLFALGDWLPWLQVMEAERRAVMVERAEHEQKRSARRQKIPEAC